MDLHLALTRAFATDYPEEAAAALEPRSPEEAAHVLASLQPDTAAGVLQRMAPASVSRVVEYLDTEYAAGIFTRLTVDTALMLLRRVTPAIRDAIIRAMPKEYANAVNTVIGFPSGTAGALMDPRMLALPSDLTVDEALKAVRRNAENAHYNLYVVDRDHVLVGVLNLHEVLQASPRDRLEVIMRPAHHRLGPDAGPRRIVEHPGWREVHSLPVVDRNDRFLGAIHFHVLHRLEDELRGIDSASGTTTVRALGDLFWTGFGGVIDAIAATIGTKHSTQPEPGGVQPVDEEGKR